MSFSSEVKEELSRHLGKSRHCQIAELAALIAFDGKVQVSESGCDLFLDSENELLNTKYDLLLKKLFDFSEEKREKSGREQKKIYETVKMWDEDHQIPMITETVNGLLLLQGCCKRAYIRGAFLAGGSISDPNKSYHFEIVCRTMPQAEQLRDTMNSFDVDAKIVERKKHFVVYLKEGAQIVDILNVMEAHVALMNLENVRILKEMRNSVNRKVNCETANISKTVNAAVKQLEDITYIREVMGLDSLPDNLKEMALLRLEYPEAPLKELGMYLDPPVGKSGVNHRLRKISEIADGLRENDKTMRKTVEVQMDAGMEARPIALMVQTANQFSSHLYLEMDGKHVNAKSIMGMMSLVLTNGVVVTIDAEGTDEVEAVEALERLLTGK